jgi:hypothetical protein
MPSRRRKDPMGMGSIKLPKIPAMKVPKVPAIKLPKVDKITWKDLGFTGLNSIDRYDERKTRTPIPQGTKTDVLLRSKGKCEKCGKSLKGLKPDIHHKNRNPSDHRKGNLLVLCPNCHRLVHS